MMKGYKAISIWGVGAAVLLAGSLANAQQEKISDQDVLNLMDTVNQNSGVTDVQSEPSATPVDRVQQTLAVVDERAAEVDVVAEDMASDELGVLDDIQVEEVDESVGTAVDNLISVRLNKVSMEEAINLFAQLSGANIIVPELTEAAQISVNLNEVEWKPALQSILDTYNYELYQRVSGSNVYAVRRRPAGAPEPQVVETFKLNYATVPNVAVLVRSLLPPDAKVSEFASRNMLVVKSTESSLSEVRAVLAVIDIVRQQVFIESKFMELSDGSQLDLGIDWKQLGLDKQGKGGIAASVGAEQLTYADGRQVTDGDFPYPSANPLAIPDFSEHIFTSVLDVDQFSLVLNALASDQGVNVVSNPKIIVANEEKANITIITKEPNLKQDRKAALNNSDDTITFTLDPDQPFFEYGIILDVTPSINTSSNITVRIKPSLTRKVDEKVVGSGDAQLSYPFITEKTVETIFNLASGQTAAIGGLTEVSDSIKERKVPLLGSIPFLGRLFSWKQDVTSQTETIIFVTVGLANTQNINEGMGLPEDSELARQRMIKDASSRKLREQGRFFLQSQEDDRIEDTMKSMKQQEAERTARRQAALQKEQEKAATK